VGVCLMSKGWTSIFEIAFKIEIELLGGAFDTGGIVAADDVSGLRFVGDDGVDLLAD
jgi:predicted ATP-dependent Lon-type protease